MRVLVIGGGASGLMAAIHAARAGAEVTVLESMEKPGKKLLATGNGRCNLTNQSAGDARYYRSSEKGVQEVLKGYTPKETLADFAGLGLFVQEKQEGCMYPASGQASSVLDLLLMEAAARKVKIKCLEKAEKIWKKDRVWQVKTPGWQYEAEKVILACGSQAAPALGADGSGYVLAKMTGHTIEKPLPALVPLKIKDKDIRQLEGVRTPAEICLKTRKESFRETGELQWTAYGISGIVVFQVSRFAVKALEEGEQAAVSVNLLKGMGITLEEAQKKMEQVLALSGNKKNEELLAGLFAKKMIPFLIKRADLKERQNASRESIEKLLLAASDIRLEVSGFKSFDAAQCCQGGVLLSQVDLSTMESKKAEGLYVTGELLDVDGPCGGYNLQWAWSTGARAGDHAGRDSERERKWI